MADMYAFTTSVADSASKDINRVKSRILEIIESIDSSMQTLSEEWTGSEYESYEEILMQWQKGAAGVAGILSHVASALDAINESNSGVRDEIQTALDEIK